MGSTASCVDGNRSVVLFKVAAKLKLMSVMSILHSAALLASVVMHLFRERERGYDA